MLCSQFFFYFMIRQRTEFGVAHGLLLILEFFGDKMVAFLHSWVENVSWLLFVLMHQHWVVCLRVLHLVILFSYWETSMFMWAKTVKHGWAGLGGTV